MTRIYIERQLVDEAWRDAQLDAGTHMLDPDDVCEHYPDEQTAIARLEDLAADWGCELSEREDNDVEDASPGVRYFQFDGPEEEEIQGYASLFIAGSASTGSGSYWPEDGAK